MSLIRFIAGLLIVLSGSLAASADTIYTVTVSVPILPSFNGTFVFSEPSILTTFTAISPADIASSGPALSSILIDPEGLGCPHSSPSVPNPVSCMEVRYAGGGFVVGDFAELLTAPGTYSVPNLTLVVASAADAGSGIVPEPTSLLLLATGILGALGPPLRQGWAGRASKLPYSR